MTIYNQIPLITYIPNGVTRVFPFIFRVFSEDELHVRLDGTQVTSGYSVTGINQNAGGNVIFSTPPVGTLLEIERFIDISRATDYQENGDLRASTLNADFDRIWAALGDFDYRGVQTKELSFPFLIPLAEWNITHNLNRYPDVRVLDSSGEMVVGDVVYHDANTLTIFFSAAFGGVAYIG